jgi:hypothetical protein
MKVYFFYGSLRDNNNNNLILRHEIGIHFFVEKVTPPHNDLSVKVSEDVNTLHLLKGFDCKSIKV